MTEFFSSENKTVVKVLQKKINLEGYLVIDSTFFNNSSGGIRISPSVNEREISGLARCMTLKYLFLNSDQGGAKAGIRAPEDITAKRRRILLYEFGKAILPFLKSSTFLPGPDMGTSSEDISAMLSDVGIRVKRNSSSNLYDSGYYTALSVFISAEEAAHLHREEIKNSRVAIEGFGAVGSSLAKLFYSAGAKVVAVSSKQGAIYNPNGLNIPELNKAKNKKDMDVINLFPREEKIAPSQLLQLPVEILCPCAAMETINKENIHSIQAKIIAPGANLPISENIEPILFEKNIFSIPHFVANCGGVLMGSMRSTGLSHKSISDLFNRHLRKIFFDLLNRSVLSNKMPLEVVMADINRKVECLHKKRQYSRKKLINFAKTSIRKGIIPRFIVRRIAPFYYKRILLKK